MLTYTKPKGSRMGYFLLAVGLYAVLKLKKMYNRNCKKRNRLEKNDYLLDSLL